MRPDSAQERAFLIPEIFETILLGVPPRSLLVDAQRVNRTWHSTITCSPAIQRFLCFEQYPKHETREPQFNTLLTEAFPPFFSHNPDSDERPRWTQECLSKIDWNTSFAKRAAYSRKEASWRQMLVVQPHITRVEVFKTWSSVRGMGNIKGRMKLPEGLRMGTLYDLVEEEAHSGSTFHSTDFDLEWHFSSPKNAANKPAAETTQSPGDEGYNGTVKVVLVRSESWINIEREDYEPPDVSDLTTEQEKEEATLNAFMSNARPHLVSKARTPISIEWGEEKNIRRWR